MQIPVYVLYELLIRLQELNPAIGQYISNKKTEDSILIRTSTGHIKVPENILFSQFNNPASISQLDMLSLLDNFKPSTA